MLLSANMHRLYNVFGIEATFDILAQTGFQGIDFNNDIEEFYTAEHDEKYYQDLAKYAADKGIKISQAHAPFPSSKVDAELSAKRFDEIVQSMRNAAYLGAPMIVVHPCTHLDYTIEGNPEILFDYNVDFYKKLIPYAREIGIQIAIENIKRNSVTSTPEKLCKLFDTLNDPVFTICFDVGHCMLQQVDPADAIRKIGDRLVNGCLHIHDNSGEKDNHTLPFYGVVEWESVVEALADIDYQGDFNYEASGFIVKLPKELRIDAMEYMAKVGHYLIDRFHYYKNNK